MPFLRVDRVELDEDTPGRLYDGALWLEVLSDPDPKGYHETLGFLMQRFTRGRAHYLSVSGTPVWAWNGDLDAPTLDGGGQYPGSFKAKLGDIEVHYSLNRGRFEGLAPPLRVWPGSEVVRFRVASAPMGP